MDNIIFEKKNIIKQLIKNAFHYSHSTEFINKNPDKYNSIVGIKGSKYKDFKGKELLL